MEWFNNWLKNKFTKTSVIKTSLEFVKYIDFNSIEKPITIFEHNPIYIEKPKHYCQIIEQLEVLDWD